MYLVVPPSELKNIVFDATTQRLFVAERDNNAVRIYDASTMSEIGYVTVGLRPFGMATLNGRVYAANFNSDSISVIDAATLSVVKTIALNSCSGQPTHIAANPSTNKLYVALKRDSRVAAINGATDTLGTCINGVGGGAFGIATNPALNRIYVTGRDSFDLRVIDGATDTQIESQRQAFEGSPYQVAVDPTNNRVYLAVSANVPDFDSVTRFYVYDADAGNLTPVGGSPFTINNNHDGGGIAASPCSGKIYIAETDNDTVRVLNSNLSVNAILNQGANAEPYGIAFGANKVFITNRNAATISAQIECP